MRRAASIASLLSAAFSLGACGPRSEKAAPSAASGASAPTAAASGSAGASAFGASSAAAPTGPCAGKKAGERACDGRSVVVCDVAGAPKVEATCLDVEACDPKTLACGPGCPEGMVYIPATPPEGFTMGRGKTSYGFGNRASGNTGSGVADTPHKVVLTKPFCMDAFEVTVADYKKCVDAGKCTLPDTRTAWKVFPDKPTMPANMIDWKQSLAFCTFAGKTLPTEAQWEWAASGPDGRNYPWGEEKPSCDLADFTPGDLPSPACDCGCHGGGASPVGSHPKGDKEWPGGKIHDLAGNVWEWCLDNYSRFDTRPATDPLYKTNDEAPHVVRGGGWNRSGAALTTSFRGTAIVGYQRPALGARCILNPKPKPG